MNLVSSLLMATALLFLSGCQDSASKNIDSSATAKVASLKYPLKTGQTNTFVFTDISTDPATFYYDDGYDKKGYERVFYKSVLDVVHNENYNLDWQDDDALLEYSTLVAKAYCSALTLGGKSDWRLPNIYELITLLDLDSRTDMRESSFDNMPVGSYFTSNDVLGTPKTIVVGFTEQDFNLTKIDKVSDVNVSTSEYGVKFATTTVPTYHVPNAGDPFSYISKVVISDVYYNPLTGFQTIVSTDTLFDADGNVISVFGPYVASSGGTQFNPILEAAPTGAYVKCVSGVEIGGFDFTRDDRNDVVVDSTTTLMWQDSKEVIQNNHKWGESAKYCSQLILAGYEDWRLPTISELITINDFTYGGTFSVDKEFKYKSASKFHSSTNSCYEVDCNQKNYQLNASGYLDDKITQNFKVDGNPYDENEAEPYYKTRCVRLGDYN